MAPFLHMAHFFSATPALPTWIEQELNLILHNPSWWHLVSQKATEDILRFPCELAMASSGATACSL